MNSDTKQTEGKVSIDNTLFRALFEDSPLGIILTSGLDCSPKIFNQAACDLLGYSREELSCRTLNSLTIPDDLEREASVFERLLACEISAATIEKRFLTKNKSVIWVKANISLIQDEQNTDESVVYRFQDITERKLAESRLAESERRFKRLFTSSPVCIHELDLEGRILSMNPAGLKMLKLTDENQIIGEHYINLVNEHDRDHVQSLFVKTCHGEYSPFQFSDPAGKKIYRSDFVPIKDETGRVIRVMGQTEDITEQTANLTKLQENEALLKLVVETLPVGVYLADKNGKILLSNKIGKEIWATDSLSAQSYRDYSNFKGWFLDSGKPIETEDWGMYRAITKGETSLNEGIEIESFDGQRKYINHSAVPIRNQKNEIVGGIVVTEDITSKIAAERALKESYRRQRDILDSLFGFVGIYTLEGVLIDANQTPMVAAGLTREEVIGKYFPDTYWWSYSESVQNQLADALQKAAKGETVRYDVEVRVMNGRFITIDVMFGPLYDEHGNIKEVLGFGVDITERKKIETALHENERQLNLIFENTSDAMVLMRVEENDKFIFQAVNKTYLNLLKTLFPEVSVDIVGKERTQALREFRLYDQMISKENLYREVLRTQEEVHFETEIVTQVGLRYFEITVKPVLDDTKSCTHLLWNSRDITARRNAEQKLRESEERLRLAMNAANQAIFDLDIASGAVNVTDEYETIFGYLPSVFDRERIHPDDRNTYDIYQSYIKGEINEYRVEFRCRTDSGEWKWILSLGKIVEWDENGKPLRMIGTHTDISKLKNSERAAHEADQHLSTVVSNAPLVLFSIDTKGVFTLSTGKGLELIGLQQGQVVGMSAFDIYAGYPEVIANLKKALAGEVTHFTSSTGSLYFDAVYSPLYDSHGVIVGATGIGLDITQRKKAEELAIQKTKELQEINDALDQSSLVSVTDKFGTILKVNKRFCEVARYEENELLGKNHRIINSKFHSKDFWKNFWTTINSGKVWRGEVKNCAKDGTEYWVYTVVNPIFDTEGEITHFLSIRQDITDRKVYEQLLLQSNSRLAQIEQFMDYTTDAIQVSNVQGQFLYINQVASDRLGIPREDCQNYNVTDVEMFFKGRKDWQKHIEQLKKTGFIQTEGLNRNQATGTTFPVEVTIRLVTIHDEDYVIVVSRDITERKKNELELLESQSRLKEAQRLAKLGYWEYDFSTNKVWLSDEQFEINGIEKSNGPISQDYFINLIHADDREFFSYMLNKSVVNESDISTTYRIVRPNGEIRIIQGKAQITIDEWGRPSKLSGVNLDVTERKLAEKAKQESETTLRKAQAIAKIGSWKLDVKNNILEWSDEVYKMFDVPLGSSLTYEDFLTYVHPEDKDYVDKSWAAAVAGARYDIVHRIIVANKIKWVREQAELTFDDFNNLIYGFGTVQDITDQQILQEANLIFNQSLLLTGLGSWRVSFKNNDLFWSDNVYTLHGLVKGDSALSYDYYLNSLYHEERERIKSVTEEALRKKGSFETEYRVQMPDGEIRWLSSKGKVLTDEAGTPIEMFGIVRDITFEKINTEELIRARKQAEDANLIKDQFLSVMSHEIRTPLNSVIGLSNLLLRRNPREDQVQVVKTLKSSADNLMHLINDILDFNKIRSGNLALELVPFSLTDFLKQQYTTNIILAQDKGLHFTIHIDPRVPDFMEGDVLRLNQIFTNLITNAIKFTHQGHVKLSAELRSSTEKKCLISFSIEDTGLGIEPEKMESIFLPFHQAEVTISRKYGGTGLGLSIVKSLVELMKGKIYLSSTLGKGSVFTIDIPFTVLNSPAKKRVAAPASSVKKKSVIRPMEHTVLYVEDVESNRFLVENLLFDNGIQCVSVSSGRAALRLTNARKFDVILMDIQMPGMDGYQAAEKIRKQPNGKNINTPVIAFTAEPYSEALKNKVAEQGIEHVITKPFDPDSLIEKIQFFSKTGEKAKKAFYSLTFYEEAFKGDKVKLRKIKKAIIADVKRFEKNLQRGNQNKDLMEMREEIHRIRPIIKNLSCEPLILLLDQYKMYDTYSPAIKKITQEVKKVTKKLLTQLSKPHLTKH